MKNSLILSPHLDDAMLSCGQHVLNSKPDCSKLTTIINVFSKLDVPAQTSFVKKQHTQLNVQPHVFQSLRMQEDADAWRDLPVILKNLNFIDGGYRTTTSNKPMYPTAKSLFANSIHTADETTVTNLTKVLLSVEKIDFDRVYVPLGIGGHADHIIVRLAAEKIWQANKITYYFDQPYFSKHRFSKILTKLFKQSTKCQVILTQENKIKRLSRYKSQFKLLFSNQNETIFPELLLDGTTAQSYPMNIILAFLLRF